MIDIIARPSKVIFSAFMITILQIGAIENACGQQSHRMVNLSIGKIQSSISNDSLIDNKEGLEVIKYALSSRNDINLIMNSDLLEGVHESYELSGVFLESKNQFSVLMKVNQGFSGYYSSVPIVNGPLSKRLELIQNGIDNAIQIILANERAKLTQLKTIAYVPKISAGYTNTYYPEFVKTVINKLIISTPSNEYYTTILPKEVKDFYYSESGDRDIMEELSSDALVKFELKKSSRTHMVEIILSIKETNEQLTVGQLNADSFNESYLRIFLNDLFSRIIDQEHNWQLQDFYDIPDVSSEIFQLGLRYSNEGDYFLSNFLFNQILSKSPQNESEIEAFYYLGKNHQAIAKKYMDQDNSVTSELYIATAQQYYERSVELDSLNFAAAFELGKINLEKGEFDKALGLFRSIQQNNPSFESIELYLGKVLYWKKDYSKAIEILSNTLERDTLNRDVIFTLGRSYFAESILDSAELCFRKSIELDYKPKESAYGLSLVLSQKGVEAYFKQNYEESVKALISSTSIYDNDVTYYYLSQSFKELGRFREAVETLELGLDKGIFSNEIIYYSIGIELYNSWYNSNFQLDSAFFYSKKTLEKHIELFPGDQDGYSTLGTVLANNKDFESALQYLRKSFEIDSSNFDNAVNLQEILLLSGETAESLNIYEYIISQEENLLGNENLVITRFLALAAKMLSGEEFGGESSQIKEFINLGKELSNWGFNLFDDWVSTISLDDEMKQVLIDLRSQLGS